MTTAKKTSTYSDEYAQTFLTALDGPVRITLESNAAAKRLRERYYAFRRHLEAIQPSGDSRLDLNRVAILAPLARMSITDNILTIYYEDTNHDRPSSTSNSDSDSDTPTPSADDTTV